MQEKEKKAKNINSKQKIVLITTGGTIEKTYDEFDGTLENRESQIKELITKKLRLHYTQLDVFSVLSKDSLLMTEDERDFLVKSIKNQLWNDCPIVVLHGTDSMVKTASLCLKELGTPQVPIIFTGAMKPMGFEDSDATQNVTEALYAAKIVSPGVYISFHNRLFTVPFVRKNKSLRSFEGISR
ncbi:MAG: asparaginase [Halobacteriovoraceae bacterium]|nr:asparaginase [Halobacteriovoraceae bacterium]